MQSTKEKFTEEFRREAVRLSSESGKSVTQLAKDLGVGLSTLQAWRRKAGLGVKRRQEVEGDDSELSLEQAKKQLQAIRKENDVLRQERDILKKAATFFANETKR